MPLTPPTSPRFGARRSANVDDFNIERDVTGPVDIFDTLAARIDAGLSSAPPAAGIVNRFFRETDTGILRIDTGSALAHITPGPHASRQQEGGADPLTVREAMMATGATGLAKGSFSAYRNAASSVATLGIVPFDTEELDVSGWFDIVAGATQGRFTPQVPGYYDFSWNVGAAGGITADGWWLSILYRNGASHKEGSIATQRGTVALRSAGSARRVLMNGTTDFVDIRIAHSEVGAVALSVSSVRTFFQGGLAGRS